MPYEWEAWALRALVGVEPYEVRQVLDAALRWPRPGAGPSGLKVLTIWGRTRAGRALIVAMHHVGGSKWKIIGVRGMSDAELTEFSRWEETR